MDTSCSNTTSSHGGYLSVGDSDGSVTETYLQEGFFDFLNQVNFSRMWCFLTFLIVLNCLCVLCFRSSNQFAMMQPISMDCLLISMVAILVTSGMPSISTSVC